MKRTLASMALALACAACNRVPVDPPPRHFMQGGVWWPAATGYWFHQYATDEDIDRLMEDLGFACTKDAQAATRMRCERGFRIPGVLARTNHVEFTFRRNGAVAHAQSGCTFSVLGFAGKCAPFAARGAVYPDVRTFTSMAEAMLRPVRLEQPLGIGRLPPPSEAPLPDAEAAFERLHAWRFECESPRRQSRVTFLGNVGAIRELTCQQWSLRAPDAAPQSQQVIVRYDTGTLAVLDVRASLDGETASLRPSLATPGGASARRRAEPPPLVLETLAGERIEMPQYAIGTGSRQQTREGFATLTPESRRALIAAYLAKQLREARRTPGTPTAIYLGSLEWYGPEAVPIVDALADDGEPDLGAAIVRYVCLDATGVDAHGTDDRIQAMTACIDAHRAALPRSLETLDLLFAAQFGKLERAQAAALNALIDFRQDLARAIALGPDGKASAAAIEKVVAGKDGLDETVSKLVARALAPRSPAAVAR